MDLFNDNSPLNLLPYDGEVMYYGKIFSNQDADKFYTRLMDNIEWKHDEAIIYHKYIVTKRLYALYGDHPYAYTYSKVTREALSWTEDLKAIKAVVEQKLNHHFNSCLLNLYPDGDTGMAWHSDDEDKLGHEAGIASISFGAERKFGFKHKIHKKHTSLILEKGSLLLMKGTTQKHWLHSLPKSKKIKNPRINLTFRIMISGDT